MTLKKTIAGYFKVYSSDVFIDHDIKDDLGNVTGTEKKFSHTEIRHDWIPEQEITMHQLEEDAIRAQWNVHEVQKLCPPAPSKEEEHEWLIEHGADFVKQKRIEWQNQMDALKPQLDEAMKKAQDCHETWCQHADLCMSKGFDPNVFDGNALEKLNT